MLPADVAAQETFTFIRAYLPASSPRLLDVGCGKGQLAAVLMAHGAEVTAIDKNEEAVCAARALGVPAVHADFLAFDAEAFDAVVFSRALHHLRPLEAVIDHAATLLKPGGRLIVEDFDWPSADCPTLTWFYGVEALLEAGAQLSGTFTSNAQRGDAVARWQAHCTHHDIHDASAMRAALERRFQLEHEARAPYLHRYAAAKLEPSERGGHVAAALLSWERSLIEADTVRAVGVRWVARLREDPA